MKKINFQLLLFILKLLKKKRTETMKDYIQIKLLNEEKDVIPVVKDEDDFI